MQGERGEGDSMRKDSTVNNTNSKPGFSMPVQRLYCIQM